MMKAIVVAPRFDTATEYTYQWSREVVDLLKSMGYTVLEFSGRVDRREVESALAEHREALFVFYDHGSEDSLWAHFGKLIDLSNVHLLAGRDCYTVACLSAKRLGVEAYKAGCRAYWGYTIEFAFTTDAADYFKEFANYGLKLRVKEGRSWRECLDKAKQLARQLATKLISMGNIVAGVLMIRNADALVCYDGEPPEAKCPFRRVAVKLFGKKVGWRLSRLFACSTLLFGLGLGTAIHDFFVECADPLRFPPHGFWIGACLVVIGHLMVIHELLSRLRSC
ncbi:MAG: hypothetical protein QXU69_10885 [Thermofilaceae archaeon]